MHSSHLISSILNGKWAIEPGFAFSQGPLIANMLNQYVAIEKRDPDKMTAFAVSPVAANRTAKYSYWDGFDRAPAGAIAIIKLKGVLIKDDQYCGPAGTATIGEVIKAADAHENISAIVLHIDSPGGTVDGTEALGNIVKSVSKPVVAFVDGLMASAALWIGSNADEIVASTDTDEIGSAGVQLSFMDVQPYWESLGIVFRSLKASTSPDKNTLFEGIRKGDKEATDSFVKEVLDPLDEKFMNILRENLTGIKEELLTGKMFFARDLMGTIVNSIGTMDDAITRAAELAKEKSAVNGNQNQVMEHAETVVDEMIAETRTTATTETSNETEHNQNSIIINMKQYANVNAALGVDALESVDNVVSLNDEQLEALDTTLGNNNSAELQAQLDAANATIGTHETTISANEAVVAAKDAEIARLKGKAVEETTAKPAGGDDKDLNVNKTKTVVNEEMDFAEQVNAVAAEYLPKH